MTDWKVTNGGKHKKLRFEWQDGTLTFTMPKSPSDYRGAKNAVSDLRAAMGVKRVVHKNPENRTKPYRKARAVLKIVPNTEPAPPKDPFAVLAQITFAEPVKLTWWQRLCRMFRRAA